MAEGTPISWDVFVSGNRVRIVVTRTGDGSVIMDVRQNRLGTEQLLAKLQAARDRLWEAEVSGKVSPA